MCTYMRDENMQRVRHIRANQIKKSHNSRKSTQLTFKMSFYCCFCVVFNCIIFKGVWFGSPSCTHERMLIASQSHQSTYFLKSLLACHVGFNLYCSALYTFNYSLSPYAIWPSIKAFYFLPSLGLSTSLRPLFFHLIKE